MIGTNKLSLKINLFLDDQEVESDLDDSVVKELWEEFESKETSKSKLPTLIV